MLWNMGLQTLYTTILQQNEKPFAVNPAKVCQVIVTQVGAVEARVSLY